MGQPKSDSEFRDDWELVQRARTGIPNAVDQLLARLGCVRRVLEAKNARTGSLLDEAQLEDLIQDTLLDILRRLPDYAGRGSIEAWAYRFCIYALMARRRRIARERSRGEAELPADLGEQEDIRPEPDLAEKVYEALDAVGPPESDVIRFKHFEDLTFAQIAERMGESPNTTKSRYYRGLQKARTHLSSQIREAEGQQ